MADQYERDGGFFDNYKGTTVFVKGGRASYGIWQPLEVQLDGDEPVRTIEQGMEGTLEFLADEEYGDRRLWQVIAHANKIDYPPRDVVPGLQVKIPKAAYVFAALQKRAKELSDAEGAL